MNCYISIFVYKMKEESVKLLSTNCPEVIVFTDALLCDATYLFVPEVLYPNIKDKIQGCLKGAYNEINKVPVPEEQVSKMMNKATSLVHNIGVGDFGYIEGFGTVLMLVTDVKDNTIIVCPVNVNLFKHIECVKDDFHYLENPDKELTYTYNSELAIDCNMFPNDTKLQDNEFYLVIKDTLARILYNVHSMLDNVKIYLYSPCPLIMLAGANLGIETTEDDLPLISDSANSCVRLNPKKGYSIVSVTAVNRHITVEDNVKLIELYNLFKELDNKTSLNLSEIYTLLNRRYFNYKALLNINLRDNPLGED